MRYKSLSSIVRQVRAEARLSTSSSVGLEANEYIEQLVRRIYETLWDDWDWEHAKLTRTAGEIPLVAGTYLYDLPAGAYVEGVSEVWGQDTGGQWYELLYGIDLSHMNSHDTAANERADPVQRWAFYDNVAGGKTQIEVWPIPESSGRKIAVTGKRAPPALADGDSLVPLDDLVVALFAAAEALAESKPAESKMKADAARARLHKMRVKASSMRERFTMGSGPVDMSLSRRGELNVEWTG